MAITKQIIAANLAAVELARKKFTVNEEAKVIMNSPLSEVKGIGENTLKTLIAAGITTVDELKALPEEKIYEVIKNPISRSQVMAFVTK